MMPPGGMTVKKTKESKLRLLADLIHMLSNTLHCNFADVEKNCKPSNWDFVLLLKNMSSWFMFYSATHCDSLLFKILLLACDKRFDGLLYAMFFRQCLTSQIQWCSALTEYRFFS